MIMKMKHDHHRYHQSLSLKQRQPQFSSRWLLVSCLLILFTLQSLSLCYADNIISRFFMMNMNNNMNNKNNNKKSQQKQKQQHVIVDFDDVVVKSPPSSPPMSGEVLVVVTTGIVEKEEDDKNDVSLLCNCTSNDIKILQDKLNNIENLYYNECLVSLNQKNIQYEQCMISYEQYKNDTVLKIQQLTNVSSDTTFKIFTIQDEYTNRLSNIQQQSDTDIHNLKMNLFYKEQQILQLQNDISQQHYQCQILIDSNKQMIESIHNDKIIRIESTYQKELNHIHNRLLDIYSQPIHKENIQCKHELSLLRNELNICQSRYEDYITDRNEKTKLYIHEHLHNEVQKHVSTIQEQIQNEFNITENHYNEQMKNCTNDIVILQNETNYTILYWNNSYNICNQTYYETIESLQYEYTNTINTLNNKYNQLNTLMNNTITLYQKQINTNSENYQQMIDKIQLINEDEKIQYLKEMDDIKILYNYNIDEIYNEYQQYKIDMNETIMNITNQYENQINDIQYQTKETIQQTNQENENNIERIKNEKQFEYIQLQNTNQKELNTLTTLLHKSKHHNDELMLNNDTCYNQYNNITLLNKQLLYDIQYWKNIYETRSYMNISYIYNGIIEHFIQNISHIVYHDYNVTMMYQQHHINQTKHRIENYIVDHPYVIQGKVWYHQYHIDEYITAIVNLSNEYIQPLYRTYIKPYVNMIFDYCDNTIYPYMNNMIQHQIIPYMYHLYQNSIQWMVQQYYETYICTELLSVNQNSVDYCSRYLYNWEQQELQQEQEQGIISPSSLLLLPSHIKYMISFIIIDTLHNGIIPSFQWMNNKLTLSCHDSNSMYDSVVILLRIVSICIIFILRKYITTFIYHFIRIVLRMVFYIIIIFPFHLIVWLLFGSNKRKKTCVKLDENEGEEDDNNVDDEEEGNEEIEIIFQKDYHVTPLVQEGEEEEGKAPTGNTGSKK